MKFDNIYRHTFSVVLPFGIICLLYLFSPWCPINESQNHQWDTLENKQKGAHVFGRIDSTNLQPIVRNNYDWITMVFWGDQSDYDSPSVIYHQPDSLGIIRRDSIWKNRIDLAHSLGFKVFLKPHIWINNPTTGKWRSDIYPKNEENWKLWQDSYRKYLMTYAKIAEDNKVELFCLGVELSKLSVKKSEFWTSLIQEVKSIYTGKLTYAANWHDEFEDITFWEELDYIGIQAYFPLVKNKYPNTQQISKGWNKYLPTLESMAKKYNRKILFTEIGYKSTSDSAIKPWEWIENTNQKDPVSYETQANCYKAFFDTVWKEEWFAGVHIWQLRSDYVKERGYNEYDFTPQGKPAESVIAMGFE